MNCFEQTKWSELPVDILTPVAPDSARVFKRHKVTTQWPMFSAALALMGQPVQIGESRSNIGVVSSVLVSRKLICESVGTSLPGRMLIVKLDNKFERHLKELAVQQPYGANWHSLDFDVDATETIYHWYLRLPDGSRHIFALSLEAIKEAFDVTECEHTLHAHVVFVAGGRVVVGGFYFPASELLRAHELMETVRVKPEYSSAELDAGIAQSKAGGCNIPWRLAPYKLVTGAIRTHLNCIRLAMEETGPQLKLMG